MMMKGCLRSCNGAVGLPFPKKVRKGNHCTSVEDSVFLLWAVPKVWLRTWRLGSKGTKLPWINIRHRQKDELPRGRYENVQSPSACCSAVPVGGVTSTDVLLGLVPKTTRETCICITEVCFTTAHTVKRAAGHWTPQETRLQWEEKCLQQAGLRHLLHGQHKTGTMIHDTSPRI